MTPQQRREVFFKFLAQNNALENWKRNVAQNTNPIWHTEESAFQSDNPLHCIGDVFAWTSAPEGKPYWETLYQLWGYKIEK